MHNHLKTRDVIHRHFDETQTLQDSHIPYVSGIILLSENERNEDSMAANYEKSVYNQLMDVMSRLDSFEEKYNQDTTELKEELSTLKAENKHLREENGLLREDNARLKSIINHDSNNTSLPPSSDQKGGIPSNTYNGREKTGRKAGGQKGHGGTTLTKEAIKEKINSGKCCHEIKHIGGPASGTYLTKYVMDLDVKPLITEIRIYADADGRFCVPKQYRSDVTYGPNVKALAVTLYCEGVMSNDRIAAFLNAASDEELGISTGSIYQFCKSLSQKAEASIAHLEDELLNQRVVATDATPVTSNGSMCFIRNFSVTGTVLYRAMKQKTLEAMHKIRFLEKFTGILVHDHETALYHFGTDHAECNVHIIRYLRKNTEETNNKWSGQMLSLLCEANSARKTLLSEGRCNFPEFVVSEYEKRYHGLLSLGREQNKKTAHLYAKTDKRKLLNRMDKYSHNHLLFLHDFEVPFDDNMSERDLRKAKNRQKMAGGFRKESGHEMYCSILTIIETLKRRNMPMIAYIKKLFMGTPAIF